MKAKVIQFTNEELISLVSFNMSFERQAVTKDDEEDARLKLEKIDSKIITSSKDT